MIVSFVSRMSFMAASSTTWLHTVEILPTALRARGHSSSNMMARLGGFARPYLVDSASYVVIGSVLLLVSLVAVVSSWNLPETSGKAMGCALEHDESTVSSKTEDSDNECIA